MAKDMCLFHALLDKMKNKQVGLLVLMILLFCSGNTIAGTIAVFPLLDITRDGNGVNFMLTENLRNKVIEDGYEVIPDNEIMDFMVRNRIRSLGTLSSYELTQLRKELGAEFAMLGTVCQLEDLPTAKISLSLQLIRTSDEEIVWSKTSDLHKDDLISLLDLDAPDSLNDLYLEYFSSIFETLPDEAAQSGSLPPSVNLMFVDMRPLYVKPGEKIDVTARFYSTVEKENLPTFHLDIDGIRHDVDVDEDAHFIRTSFLASNQNGSYEISLVAEFPSGENQVLRIGDYTVDSVIPELSINLIGTEIDETMYFSRDLMIMTKMVTPEKLSMWEVKVYDEVGDTLVFQSGEGQVPDKIIWNGRDDNLEKVPDGRYKVAFTVWDRALNKGYAEQFILHRHLKPEILFYVNRSEDTITVELENQIDYQLKFWFAKMYKKSGTLVATKVGEKIPPSLEFKIAELGETENLEFIFAAQDVYGNKSYISIPDFLNLDKKDVILEVVPESQWLENF